MCDTWFIYIYRERELYIYIYVFYMSVSTPPWTKKVLSATGSLRSLSLHRHQQQTTVTCRLFAVRCRLGVLTVLSEAPTVAIVWVPKSQLSLAVAQYESTSRLDVSQAIPHHRREPPVLKRKMVIQ